MPVGYGYNFGGMLGSGPRPTGGVAPGGGGSPGTGGAGVAPGLRFGVGAPPSGGGYAAPPQLPPAPPWGGTPPGNPFDSVNAARPPQAGFGPAPWIPPPDGGGGRGAPPWAPPDPLGGANAGLGTWQAQQMPPGWSGGVRVEYSPTKVKPPGYGTQPVPPGGRSTMGFDPYKPGGY